MVSRSSAFIRIPLSFKEVGLGEECFEDIAENSPAKHRGDFVK
jgi:hypothetical protein